MRIILLIMIGLSLLQAEYIRDEIKEVVLDTTTSLMWQDDATPATMTWADAITYCEAKALGGYSDWHLPNKNELKSIEDKTTVSPAISSVFQNVVNYYYWSSTTYVADTTFAWYVNFHASSGTAFFKTNTYNVRCVR